VQGRSRYRAKTHATAGLLSVELDGNYVRPADLSAGAVPDAALAEAVRSLGVYRYNGYRRRRGPSPGSSTRCLSRHSLCACCTTDRDKGGTSSRQNVCGPPSSTWRMTARMTAESAITMSRPAPGVCLIAHPATRAMSVFSDSPPIGALSGSVRQPRNPSGSCSATQATDCPDHAPADQARRSSHGEATSPSAAAVSAARRSGPRQTELRVPTRPNNRTARV